MYEIPDGRHPELILGSMESNDVVEILKFRLRCKREQKVGMITIGFGRSYWVDTNGEYMDGTIHPKETELNEVLIEFTKDDD